MGGNKASPQTNKMLQITPGYQRNQAETSPYCICKSDSGSTGILVFIFLCTFTWQRSKMFSSTTFTDMVINYPVLPVPNHKKQLKSKFHYIWSTCLLCFKNKKEHLLCATLIEKVGKNVLYIATAISLLLKGKRLSDPQEVTTRPFKCLSSPKWRDLQTDSLTMDYSRAGKTLLLSQISTGRLHHLLVSDINKRCRLKGEKKISFRLLIACNRSFQSRFK